MSRLLSRIPWRRIKRGSQRRIRRRFFRLKAAHPYQILDADRKTVKEVLARNHFATGHMISYYDHEMFGGERLNMRRIESLDPRPLLADARPGIYPLGRFVVCPHFELCPVEHPLAPLDKEGLNVPIGMEKASKIWNANGITVLNQS